jgi:hypothetical protein
MEEYRLPPGSEHQYLWGAFGAVAKEYKIHKSMVSRWVANSLHFESLEKKKDKARMKLGAGKHAQYPEQEDMLFDAVYIRRQLLGLWVDRYWLQDEMLEILRLTQPKGWQEFKCSSGWVSSFCRRYCITQQARTNKKDVPAAAKQPLVQEFHRQMLALQRSKHFSKPCDPVYGRFSPFHMFHADQSPCEWAMPGKRTLNIQNTPCWVWQPGTGLDKRFITIHLCIRAAGDQIIKPVVIFRGQGVQISQTELDELNKLTNIRWYFQPKAWADGEFCRWWLSAFESDLKSAD